MERDAARDLFWSHAAQFAVPRKAIPPVAGSTFQIIRFGSEENDNDARGQCE
jgi:hypothetical protein